MFLSRGERDLGVAFQTHPGRQEEKGTTEDEMIGWHHQLDGYEFEKALEVGGGQGSLAS